MNYTDNKVENLKIAYIGGGSRGWAWGLMSDLAIAKDISGEIHLYDIDFEAAKNNEIIGNSIEESEWKYIAVKTIGEALDGADFVIISILPGTFDEMESDVHLPEEYGIYQSVGDTSGPGGIVRALRALPMFEEIATAIRKHCPEAWVINYTNPMTMCTDMLYRTFPEIKAFGCCHEVFGTQTLLARMLGDKLDIKGVKREEIRTDVIGVNHFTWLTSAQYKNIDLFPIYREFAREHRKDGYDYKIEYDHINNVWRYNERVKFDLFSRYGYIAAAGDRHLAEFCPGSWYLDSPEQVCEWGFALTPVSWRKNDLKSRLERAQRLVSGEEKFKITPTGEEGVNQIRALLGLKDLVTNVNIPNVGQVPNLPIGAVVETNATFRANSLVPVMTNGVPKEIYSLISRISGAQQLLVDAIVERDIEKAFMVFANDPLVRLPLNKARELFDRMIANTSKYLGMYNL